jgi:hypothetical protein
MKKTHAYETLLLDKHKEEVAKHYVDLLSSAASNHMDNIAKEIDKHLIDRNHLQLFVKMFNKWANNDGSSTSSQLSSFRLPRFETLALEQFQFYIDTKSMEHCFVCKNCKKTFRVSCGAGMEHVFCFSHILNLHTGIRKWHRNDIYDRHLKAMNPLIHEPCSEIVSSQILFEQYRVALNRDTWDISRLNDEEPIRRATMFHDFLSRMFQNLSTYYFEDKVIVMAVIADEDLRQQQEEEEKDKEQKRKEASQRRKQARPTTPSESSRESPKKTGFSRKKSRTSKDDTHFSTKNDDESSGEDSQHPKQTTSKQSSKKPARKTGFSTKQPRKRKDPPPHFSDASDDESLEPRQSKTRSRVQTLNEEVQGWGYTGPKIQKANAKGKENARIQSIKRKMAMAAIEWDDFVLQEDWKSLIYVNRSLRGEPQDDKLIEELSFTRCKRLKTNVRSKFFVGITGKGRKFIVHEKFFNSNTIFSFHFIQNVKKNSNEEHKLTAAMKAKLKKQRLLYSVNYQIIRIAKTTDKNKAIVYKGWSLKEAGVLLDLEWIEENFKVREPEFYNALTNSKVDKVVIPVPIGRYKVQLRPTSIVTENRSSCTDAQEIKHSWNTSIAADMDAIDVCEEYDQKHFKTSCNAPELATQKVKAPKFKSWKAPRSSSFKLSAKAPRQSLIPDDSPSVFYQQRQTSSCIMSSLASALYYMGHVYASEYIIRRKQLSLEAVKDKRWGRMRFCHDVMMGCYREKNEMRLNYKVEEWKNGMEFDIFRNVSQYPTVCALIDSSHGTGHCITVCNKWIFDSNFEWAFPLTQECLNYICKSDDDPDITFVGVAHALRAIPPKIVQTKYNI